MDNSLKQKKLTLNEGKQSPSNFVNVGKENWLKLREEWKKPRETSQSSLSQQRSNILNPDKILGEVLSENKKDKLSEVVPLPDIVSLLAEG